LAVAQRAAKIRRGPQPTRSQARSSSARPRGRAGEALRRLREAVLAACEAYAALDVPYALVGGLAAGAHGRPRFTKDIGFLVGEAAFEKRGLIIAFAKPMPLQAGDVAIDPIPLPDEPARRAVLMAALANPDIDTSLGRAIPLLSATWLAYMKLASPRGKDRDDIVGMMLTGKVDEAALTAAVVGDDVLLEGLAAAVAERALADDE